MILVTYTIEYKVNMVVYTMYTLVCKQLDIVRYIFYVVLSKFSGVNSVAVEKQRKIYITTRTCLTDTILGAQLRFGYYVRVDQHRTLD